MHLRASPFTVNATPHSYHLHACNVSNSIFAYAVAVAYYFIGPISRGSITNCLTYSHQNSYTYRCHQPEQLLHCMSLALPNRKSAILGFVKNEYAELFNAPPRLFI